MTRTSHTFARLRQAALVALLSGVALWVSEGIGRAGDWMFRRSYFSHALPPELSAEQVYPYPLPISRSAYRRPILGTTPGFSARGGHRFSHVFLGTGGTFDVTTFHHDWFEMQPP